LITTQPAASEILGSAAQVIGGERRECDQIVFGAKEAA